ncbi:sulfite reductase (ferredoxin) [Thermosporothrix hazakensis]|jgi:sulfite reductase (ferredoxin)|uniref:assimilatory sulfite reductase (NADPH) n=1 Tax=Thermosporothrix hazakensis TaxID=644383 RepID=A0A326U4Q8_THEHA|nr:NADPH-dependent assimilatory sulfite reductase hemoprotein subunit [Thermosporothrix hazakensis]PZW26298.1 sulfite reductase (ferredoxin) [Thermosporothrix hazakensis]GCE48749.1 sulfite reductase subunit beta [Thermosporothrix hazakensis]
MTASEHSGSENSHLKALGPGEGSKVEQIKVNSHLLRGKIAEELAEPTSHFTEDQIQLIKFHGIYQQDDRDLRQVRKAARAEKAYQFMVRSRIPGGVLTPEQYLVQDELADRYGNGTLRFTTRQSIQLHGILKENLHQTIHDINKALLSTLAACGDVNRNVMACPAPTSSRAQARVQEFAHRLAMHLAPRSRAYSEIWVDGKKTHIIESPDEVEPMYGPTYLPRKFKVGIAFPGDNCIDVYTQDIGLIARLDGDKLIGFTVVIGGGMGMTHGKSETFPRLGTPLCDASTDTVVAIAEAILTVQRDYGDRKNRKHARMKYVVDERGIDWFRDEVERRLGFTLAPPSPVELHAIEDHLGWQQQADGRWFLGLHIENGRVRDTETAQVKTGLREVVAHFRPGVRLTPQQNILLTDIEEAQRDEVEAMLKRYGIVTDPAAIGAYRFAMACPALPTCGLAVAESERVLPELVKEIETSLEELGLAGEPISIRMTGCPNGCARPYMGDIGLVGRSKDLYNVYIGGDQAGTRLNVLYAASVPLKNIPATLQPVLALWKQERQREESFGDFCHRVGIERLRERTTVATA